MIPTVCILFNCLFPKKHFVICIDIVMTLADKEVEQLNWRTTIINKKNQ